MHSLIAKLLEDGPVVTDGSWGTQMQARGLKRGESPDSWNLTHPDQVEAVARSYVDAGSRIILTNTFSANRVVLEKVGVGEKTVEINEAGVKLSKRAAADRALVFASIGPTGKLLVTGEITEDELRRVFTEQAQTLARAGADGLVIETMMDLAEIKIALEAAKAVDLPVVASMVYDSGKDKDRTMMGHSPEEAAQALAEAGADVIGANCGQGIEGFLPICRRLKEASDRPVWIKPNAGLPEMIEGRVVYNTTPEEFASFIPGLLEAGASFIGGCCGTNQDFIAAVARAVKA